MMLRASLLALAFTLGGFAPLVQNISVAETPLARLAAEMKPGAWAELPTEGLTGSLRTSNPPSRGLDIMGWTDNAFWDSRTKQFLYLGMRQTRKFIAYSEVTNAWREIPLPDDHETAGSPHVENQYGHIYGNNAYDPERNRFYHMYHGGADLSRNRQPGGTSYFDVHSETWSRVTDGNSMTGCIEYFSARKGLVFLGNQGRVRFFSDESQAFEDLGTIDVCGHHSLARHNPYREEVLMAGGNHSRRTVVRLTKDGKFETMRESPVDLGISSDKLTVDPVSGNYLILRSSERKFYEFDSRKNAYRLIDDFTTTPWPFRRYDMPVVASIPEYGVTMWVASKVMLYKATQSER